MKIGFYINVIGGGGAERVVANLANQFSEDNNEVIVITSIRHEREYYLNESVKRYNLEEKEINGRLKKNISRISKLRKIVKSEKMDILISFMAEPNYRAVLATIGMRTKCLISVRNDPNREYAGRIGRFLGKYLLPLADACVFQTTEAQAWFPSKLQRKSTIIPNAVKEDFFHIKRKRIPGLIVTCGRLTSQKNHTLLINAFCQIASDFPEALLQIYGEGELRGQLQKFIDSTQYRDRITLMGATNNVPDVLSKADLFVLSSDYEGMPNALMEAMAAGVACISTDCPCGGSKMLINTRKCGVLVPINDVSSLSVAIQQLLSNDDMNEMVSKSGKERALSFSPEKIFTIWKQYVFRTAHCND
ncbi:MAG: glycosyltransferase [Ruminococcus sp.]|nr:glycosyltransferase [Ruminococcus sp.]